jgi:hypothetical protein
MAQAGHEEDRGPHCFGLGLVLRVDALVLDFEQIA